ncbi:PepSY-associated TM helix domain-containing protein [Longibacter salinarum]|uniref:PepSY-associated TM helix domain-containing protein n=1 Tax=Longibacter salinarum TaxID=1850348 RepID=UPI0015CF730C|nr:PepSY-associated TM helix domain-containing protein [Longibacter salinarum]
MPTIRQLSSTIHLWTGLALSGIVILLSVTGSVLVFKDTIDAWMRPDLYEVESAGEQSVGRAVHAIPNVADGESPWLIELSGHRDTPVVVWMGQGEEHVFVDPYRQTVLGRRAPDAGFVNTLFDLHAELMAGRTGGIIVGVSGLLLVLVSLTGLVLWWPRRLRALRAALVVVWKKGWKRLNYDLHRAGGFYTLGFVLLTATTGAALIFYTSTQELTNTATGSPAWPPAPPTVDTPVSFSPTAIDAALDSARSALPGATASFVYAPAAPEAPLTVRLQAPGEWHPNGRSFVHIASDGSVLRVDDARSAPVGSRIMHATYPLHIGAVGGPVVRWLYVLLGLAPAVLSITGTIIWYRRWKRTVPDQGGDSAPDAEAPVPVRAARLPE